jgi:dGTPase
LRKPAKSLLPNGLKSADDVRHAGLMVATFSDEMQPVNQAIKSFLMKYMYRHYKVNRMTSKARRVVRELFEFFVNEPECMPPAWYAQTDGAKTVATAAVVADFIAGMTDRFALDEYARIFDPKSRG